MSASVLPADGDTVSVPQAGVLRPALLVLAATMWVWSSREWVDNLLTPAGRAEQIFFGLALASMAWAGVMTCRRPFRCVGYFFLVLPVLNVARKWVSVEDQDPSMVPSSVLLWGLTTVFLLRTRADPKAQLPRLRLKLVAYVTLPLLSILSAQVIGVPESRASLSYLTGILEPLALFYLTYLCCVCGDEAATTLQRMAFSGGACVVLWAVIFRLGAESTLYFRALDDAEVRRSILGSFTFGSSLHYAASAVVLLPLTFVWDLGRTGWSAFARYAVLALLLLGLSVGASRGAFLAVALQLVLLAAGRLISPRTWALFIPAVAGLAWTLFGDILLRRVDAIGGSSSLGAGDFSKGDLSRFEAWSVGLISTVNYPLGVGGGNFDFSWSRWSGYTAMYKEIGGPHLLWLSLAAEYGVPFLLAFVAFVGSLLGFAWRAARRHPSPPERRLARALAVAISGFLVYGSIGDAELSHLSARAKPMNAHTLYFFAALGAVAALHRRASSRQPPLLHSAETSTKAGAQA